MNQTLADFVHCIRTTDVPWIPYGLVPDSYFRILKADEASNVVVLNFRMAPNTVTQLHDHYCTALAYTLEGEWMYGDQVFKKGDMAFEVPGEVHQPVTKSQSAELLTILFGPPGEHRFLKNIEEDGTVYNLTMKMFKKYERISPEEAATLDINDYVELCDE